MGGSTMAGKGQEKGEPAGQGSGNFSAHCCHWELRGSEGGEVVPDPVRVSDKCKEDSMGCCLGKDPGEGAH